MKAYFLPLLLLLVAGCNDKAQVSFQQQPALSPTRITPANTAQLPANPLLSQHVQEINAANSSNPFQVVVEQSIRGISEPLQQNILETMGTELQSVATDYNGQHVTFQYQVWQIRQPSVCSQVKDDVGKFSACTLAAKALFQEMCDELNRTQSAYHRKGQLQRMYCKAANEFKPTVAQISHSQPANTGGDGKIQGLRQSCNDLTFTAMISEKDADIKARDKACAAYKKAASLE
jgi:hypothetical protein